MLPWVASLIFAHQIKFILALNIIFTPVGIIFAWDIPVCSPDHDHHAHVCYVEEDSPVTTHLMDLTTTICPSLMEHNHSQSFRFILFPSTQPFYNYFTIRYLFDPKHSSNAPIPQLLYLKAPIDRESLCLNEIAESLSGTVAEDSLDQVFSGALSTPAKSHTGCICEKSVEWCSVYVQLALTPHRGGPQSTELLLSSIDLALNILDLFIVEVRIMDVNDHAPLFLPDRFELRISEAEQIGGRYRLPSATDKDTGRNAQFAYRLGSITANIPVLQVDSNDTRKNVSLESGSEYFELSSNMDCSELFVTAKQPLDREKFESFYLIIEAVDMGSTSINTGSLFLTIHVVDSNDRSPVFQQNHYVFHVSEAAKPGTIVGQLVATDEDIGENGRVTYEQPAEASGQMTRRGTAVNRFHVEPVSGQIRVHSPLDREASRSVHFRVIALDHGQPLRTATASVMIVLQDINDNSPVIRIWGRTEILESSGLTLNASKSSFPLLSAPGLSDAIGFSVSEALDVTAVIAFMDVYDLDAQENGDVFCTAYHESFSLQPITDYPTLLKESSGLGGPGYIAQVSNNNNIFDVRGGKKAYQIVSTRSLDRETLPMIHVPIVCKDNGTKITRSTTTLLYIQVSDVNDNPPIFNLPEVFAPAVWLNKDQYHEWFHQMQKQANNSDWMLAAHASMEIVIPELCPPNQTIVRFSAHDADEGNNALLIYDIVMSQTRANSASEDQNEPLRLLTIHPKTGDVSIQIPLWYVSVINWYEYTVRVTDQGKPNLASSLKLSVSIRLANKAEPKMEIQPVLSQNYSPSLSADRSIIRLWLTEHQTPGTVIARAIASDEDHGEAGKVKFFLSQCLQRLINNSWAVGPCPFSINEISGLITNVRVVDRELDTNQYRITVVAQDHGKPPKKTSTDVLINILDRNDHSPQFRLPFKPCHSTGHPNPLFRMRDPTAFQTVAKSMTNQIIVHNLTRAFPELYSLSAVFYDRTTSTDALQPMIEFSALDPDEGVNGHVEYQLVPGCMGDVHGQVEYQDRKALIERTFSIDKSSGCLNLIRTIQYDEIGNRYSLHVVAKDGGTERSFSTLLDLWISVEGQPNSYLELWLNLTTEHSHCSTHTSELLEEMDRNIVSEVTATIRVLMSVTTVIGALIVLSIVVLFIKQPAWIFGRRLHHEQEFRNNEEIGKMDIFQCREGKQVM
ncbi:hypothetical protein FGIG_09508 [Fasciola gigantica]|uniref:Cadherin domain-containing protein n=1 Tax=Fasciola gigantica TaxID=46835 RepID=A0A504YLM2_FASGI|nr:hypothetical protein FGIG_09508 [Fasciola gigantica]